MKKVYLSSDYLDSPATDVALFLWQPWSMVILREFMVFGGTRRFEQLRQGLGISRNVLTERLTLFLDNEIIKKVPMDENSKRQEYKLRRKGWELLTTIMALHQWSERWRKDGRPKVKYLDNVDQEELADVAVYSKSGRKLYPSDIVISAKCDFAKQYLKKYRSTKGSKGAVFEAEHRPPVRAS